MDTKKEKNFDYLCRACMVEMLETAFSIEQRWQSIFDTIEECGTLPITELLSNTIPQLEVKQSDGLPKRICKECLQQLINVYRFQQMCLQSDRKMRELIVKMNADFKKPLHETLVECEINIEQRIDVECVNTVPEAIPTNDYDPLQNNFVNNETCDNNGLNAACVEQEELLPTIKAKREEKKLKKEQHKKLNDQKDARFNTLKFECEFCNRRFKKPESLHKHGLTHESIEDKQMRELIVNKYADLEKLLPETVVSTEQSVIECVNILPEAPPKNDYETCDNNGLNTECSEQEELLPIIKAKRDEKKLKKEQHKKLDDQKDARFNTLKFECEFCNRRFKKPESLHKHGLTHESIEDKQMRELIDNKYADLEKSLPETVVNTEQSVIECVNTLPEAPPKNDYETCDNNGLNAECSGQEDFVSIIKAKREKKQLKKKQHKKLNDQKEARFYTLKFECEFCDRRFKKPESLHKHRLAHKSIDDNQPQSYDCDLCEKSYKSEFALWKHKRIEHFGRTFKKYSRQYTCEICNKSYTTKSNLTNHKRIHTGERPYLCNECGKSFISRGNMEQHRLRHSDIKAYECSYCPLKFNCKSNATKHKLRHSLTKKNICDTCGKDFRGKDALRKHLLYTHSDERPFKCDYCEMCFIRPDAQRRHMLTHTGEKPFKCKYCDRAFAQRNDQVKHLRSHLGENVYWCTLCPSAFRLSSERRAHLVTHKNEDKETRERNLKALKDKEAELQLKLFKNEAQQPLIDNSKQQVDPSTTTNENHGPV